MPDSESTDPDAEVPGYEGVVPPPTSPELLDGDYLDDDPDGMWEQPPRMWDRARFGNDEAWARQRTRNASRDGLLEPQIPVARLPRKGTGPKTHQVNFRTTDAGYDDLTQAATIFGVSRAALAAVLVRDGVYRILREHARTLRS